MEPNHSWMRVRPKLCTERHLLPFSLANAELALLTFSLSKKLVLVLAMVRRKPLHHTVSYEGILAVGGNEL